MQTGAATVENSMEFPQKTKNSQVFYESWYEINLFRFLKTYNFHILVYF